MFVNIGFCLILINRCGWLVGSLSSGFTFAFLNGSGGQHLDELLAVDAVLVVDVHVFIGIVALLAGEFVAPGHEGVSQVLTVDETVVVFERVEGVDDDIVVVRAARLPLGEHGQEHGEVDGTGSVGQHLVQLFLGSDAAQFVEGGAQIVLAEDAVLVAIHQLEAFFVLLHLALAEHGEDIAARSLGLFSRRFLGRLFRWGSSGCWSGSRSGFSGRSFSYLFLLLLLLLLLSISHFKVSGGSV